MKCIIFNISQCLHIAFHLNFVFHFANKCNNSKNDGMCSSSYHGLVLVILLLS